MRRRCRSSSWSTTARTDLAISSETTESASRPFGGARFVVGAVLLALGIALVFLAEPLPDPLVRGAAAPDFELPHLDDKRGVTLSEHRGQVVLVNFWATWCKPCEDEMPAMERLYRELAPQGFELLALSVDKDTTEVAVFRDRLDISFPILLDTDEEVSRLYQTAGLSGVAADRRGRQPGRTLRRAARVGRPGVRGADPAVAGWRRRSGLPNGNRFGRRSARSKGANRRGESHHAEFVWRERRPRLAIDSALAALPRRASTRASSARVRSTQASAPSPGVEGTATGAAGAGCEAVCPATSRDSFEFRVFSGLAGVCLAD